MSSKGWEARTVLLQGLNGGVSYCSYIYDLTLNQSSDLSPLANTWSGIAWCWYLLHVCMCLLLGSSTLSWKKHLSHKDDKRSNMNPSKVMGKKCLNQSWCIPYDDKKSIRFWLRNLGMFNKYPWCRRVASQDVSLFCTLFDIFLQKQCKTRGFFWLLYVC